MQSIKLIHEYDPDLTITLAAPGGERTEDAFAEFFDSQTKREYFARYELVRAFAVEPKGEDFVTLMRAWSGLANAAWPHVFTMCEQGVTDHDLLDPRALLDGSEASAVHLAAMGAQGVGSKPADRDGPPPPPPADMARRAIESWIRAYPRKGPPGRGQLVVAKFPWGYYVCRAAEPSEWFDVEDARKSGRHYSVAKTFVKSCTLFPSVPDVLARNQATPVLVSVLGGMIRTSAGEDLAKRVGESYGA